MPGLLLCLDFLGNVVAIAASFSLCLTLPLTCSRACQRERSEIAHAVIHLPPALR